MKASFKHTEGFTLIEILVALTIVSVGVLALGSFSISTLGSGQTSRERLIAVHLAEQLLEDWQQTDKLPKLDYCKPTVAWNTSTVTSPNCPTQTTTSLASSCIPIVGSNRTYNIPYNITAIESQVCGPSKSGGTAFVPFAGTPTPKTKLVNVSWTRKGKTRAVFLTDLSKVP